MSKSFEVRFAYMYKAVVSIEADTEYEAVIKARKLIDESVELVFDDSLVDDVSMPEEVYGYALFDFKGDRKMSDFKENMQNGLVCGIDWLSFTITANKSIGEVLAMFGFTFQDFHELDKGANGYKRMILLHGSTLRVLFDGNANMGIHFDVSGSAIGDLVEYYKRGVSEVTPWDTLAIDIDMRVVAHMLDRIMKYGQVTRLDLAVDNIEKIYFRVPELYNICMKGRCVSKFRSCSLKEERHFTEELSGCTVYMGSRTSSVFLRVYDKQLEQNSKCGADGELIDYEWVRWELELKDARADQAARLLLQQDSVGVVCIGILSNYFRIINFDDSNKSRCSTDIKWQRFIDGVEKLQLYVPGLKRSLEDKYYWIQKQVAPTLTGLIIANYGDISFLFDEMELHAGRMSGELRGLVSAAHPGWEKCFSVFSGES